MATSGTQTFYGYLKVWVGQDINALKITSPCLLYQIIHRAVHGSLMHGTYDGCKKMLRAIDHLQFF